MLFAAGLLALPIFLADASLPETDAATRAIAYIRSTQQPDGGFSGAQHGAGQTMDAIYALRSAGIDPATVTANGLSPADFLRANAGAATDPASAAKAALAARALDLDPRGVAGADLIARIQRAYDGTTNRYAADDFGNSLAVLGLQCNGVDAPAGAATAIRTAQLDDGGWGFGGASDPDTTAIALQALLAAGAPRSDADVQAAVAYFREHQGSDAGWGFATDESNANSTAFVLQALLAAGEDPGSPAYAKNGVGPVQYVVSLQQGDGSFPGFDPAFATNQVVPALMGRTFCAAVSAPLLPVSAPTVTPTAPVAPAPPPTGSGVAPGDPGVPWVVGAAFALLTVGTVALAASRRRVG